MATINDQMRKESGCLCGNDDCAECGGVQIRRLNPMTPIHFAGADHSDANNWNGLPQLLRAVADYLDQHPELNATGFCGAEIKLESDLKESAVKTYFTATLNFWPDSDAMPHQDTGDAVCQCYVCCGAAHQAEGDGR